MTFYNGRKIPIISPLLINNKLETDLKKKTHHFNIFFASKCTPLINNSVLPNSFDYISTAKLSSINFNNLDTLIITKSLNVNKAHGDDDISVRMISLCGQSNVKPLSIIFKNCIDNITFIIKLTNRFLIIIDMFLIYQFLVKFSKSCYSIQYLNFLMIIIFSILISQESDHQIPVNK